MKSRFSSDSDNLDEDSHKFRSTPKLEARNGISFFRVLIVTHADDFLINLITWLIAKLPLANYAIAIAKSGHTGMSRVNDSALTAPLNK